VVKALLGKGAEKDAKDKVMWGGRFCESRVRTARKHAPPHASSGSDCWKGGVGVVCSGEKGAPAGAVRLGARTDASLPMHARRARQDGDTALMLASHNGHLEVVKALLGKGAEKEA
jgi:hypothetical protein